MTILTFADAIGEYLTVTRALGAWVANFDRCGDRAGIADAPGVNGTLYASGHGATVDAALTDYAKRIAGKCLVFGSLSAPEYRPVPANLTGPKESP